MNVLSLFTGIGGMDLGLERAGFTTVGQVEINPFCRSVLDRHWPEVPKHDDVRTAVDWWRSEPRPRVDVVAGGPPCQGHSVAGKQRGTADERWGWPAFRAVVEAVEAPFLLIENSPNLVRTGLLDILRDLADLGFDAWWSRVPAAAVGAPHLRWRLFLIAAHTDRAGLRREPRWGDGADRAGQHTVGFDGGTWALADTSQDDEPDEPTRRDDLRLPVGPIAGTGRGTGGGSPAAGDRFSGGGAGVVAASLADAASLRLAGGWRDDGDPSQWSQGDHESTGRGEALANPDSTSRRRQAGDAIAAAGGQAVRGGPAESGRRGTALADSDGAGLPQWAVQGSGPGGVGNLPGRRVAVGAGGAYRARLGDWPAEPDVGRVVDGSSSRLDRRLRVERIHALGNALVPAVGEYVGHLLLDLIWASDREEVSSHA